MTARKWALLAALSVSLIYGMTFTIAKDVMPAYVAPFGFILLRVGGSTVLFWLVAALRPKQKIAREDYFRIMAAALFGVAINMLTFFKGLSLTSPISAAVIMVTTPIIVLILSAVLMREKMKPLKVLGISLGLAGTVLLIAFGKSYSGSPNATLGNLLVFINAVSYGLYLIIVKNIMARYDAFVLVKWIYTFGLLMVLPFGWSELQAVDWVQIPTDLYWKIGFVVVFSTFGTYLLNLLSMRELKPTTVAVFIYLQPLFAALIAIGLGKDHLNSVKLMAAALIFVGVYLVTQKNTPKASS
ncbi:DMT family transporter [Flavobacterium sp. CYK-55]|uniref:DMT family transporter n=1 Tax=Flavobacterium sp. CYK-55 TaxID=2835529 RepID=UPI001BCDE9C3|nr:DMT family transporter [Flavobacterium sp. CYK-55]MBS7786078.1 DMT family transporter [Flavobacterium sp. CYK-55]